MSQELSYPWIAPDAGPGRVLAVERQVGFRLFSPDRHRGDFMSQPIIGIAGGTGMLETGCSLLVIEVKLSLVPACYLHLAFSLPVYF